jgi:DNA-binding beta-propeller fold protein YncE
VTFTVPGFSSQAVYTASNNLSRIYRYAGNASGSATATLQINGGVPLGVALDGTNEYVVEQGLTIDVYPIGTTTGGPTRTIGGPLSQLCNPVADAVYNGTLYVADTCAGILEWPTSASGNVAPANRINGAATGLSAPSSVAVNAFGIYVANRKNNGAVVTFPLNATGNQTPTLVIPSGATSFDTIYGPQGIAVDASGNVYVSSDAGPQTNTVSVFAPGATTQSYAITGGGSFCAPEGLQFDGSGNLWVANQCQGGSNAYAINKVAVGAGNATNAPLTTIGGSPNVNYGVSGCCAVIAVDPSTNDVYSANPLANTVTQFSSSGALLSTLVNGPYGALSNPAEIAFDSAQNMYVADSQLGTISVYGPGQTTPSRVFWAAQPVNSCGMRGLAVDSAGHVYATNSCFNGISEFPANASGATAPIIALFGGASGLSNPQQIALDSSGNLYVANQNNNSVAIFANGLLGNGVPTAVIAGANTTINSPSGVAVDPAGYVYVLSNGGGAVDVFAPGATGNVAPVRTITSVAAGNGQLAVDAFQNVYVNGGGGFQVWSAVANGPVAANITVTGHGGSGGIAISPTQP